MLLLVGCAFIDDEEVAARKDFDGDGEIGAQFGGGDCADGDAAVHSLAVEICDGLDNDCDGDVDGGATDAPTWYADADEDGFGGASVAACAAPEGYVAVGGDCDNGNASINPAATDAWYDGVDSNCDGANDYDRDADGYDLGDECDDEDPAIHPGATEVWYDDVDQDCSGTSDFDQDGDSFDIGDDCDDQLATTYPGAEDAWYDGVDANCDGASDFDADGDGFDTPEDCEDGDAAAYPGAVEWCDAYDSDCDGEVADDESIDAPVWNVDLDGDGLGGTDTYAACAVPDGYVDNALDCDDGSGEIGEIIWYVDGDSDGYGGVDTVSACSQPVGYVAEAGDCDDGDSSISPGHDEKCDAYNEDEDCDGVSDDDDASATGLNTYYLDADGDRYGDASVTVAECDRNSGYVTNNSDCDDGDEDVNPAADEVCDSLDVDEDCDGVADDSDDSVTGTTTYYLDSDGDGYGSRLDSLELCSATAGYLTDASDCDDSDATLNASSGTCYVPLSASTADYKATGEKASSGVWLTGDGGDVDADGFPDLLVATNDNTLYVLTEPISGSLAAATARLVGSTEYIYGISGVGDFDGDAVEDIALGAGSSTLGGDSAGAAFVLTGPFSGDFSLSKAKYTFTGAAYDYAGEWVGPAGDADADGVSDLLVGCRYCDDAGRDAGAAHIVTAATAGTTLLSDAVYTIMGEAEDDSAGVGGFTADFSGDGVSDVVIGADDGDGDASTAGNLGAVYLVLGPLASDVSLTAADAKWVGPAAGSDIGDHIWPADDLDGDGQEDVLVGARMDHDGGYYYAGAVYVLNDLAAGGMVADAQTKIVGETAGQYVGTRADTGDFNGDGEPDLVAGALGDNSNGYYAGAVFVLLGPIVDGSHDLGAADAKILGEDYGDFFGVDVRDMGDTDGDGLDEFAVTAEDESSAFSGAGAIYAFLGGWL